MTDTRTVPVVEWYGPGILDYDDLDETATLRSTLVSWCPDCGHTCGDYEGPGHYCPGECGHKLVKRRAWRCDKCGAVQFDDRPRNHEHYIYP